MNAYHSIIVLALGAPLVAVAQSAYDSPTFAKRFNAADTNKDGKLSRAEAYAAFPSMPKHFEEIDINRDGSITLVEIDAAMKKRVDAALEASKTASGHYVLPAGALGSTAVSAATVDGSSVLVNKDDATLFHGSRYYEGLAGEFQHEETLGEPVGRNPAPGQLQMSF